MYDCVVSHIVVNNITFSPTFVFDFIKHTKKSIWHILQIREMAYHMPILRCFFITQGFFSVIKKFRNLKNVDDSLIMIIWVYTSADELALQLYHENL